MKILALNLEIGLGHASYLDYVLSSIKFLAPRAEINYWNVLEDNSLKIKILGEIARRFYYLGSQGGIFTKIYNKLRRRANRLQIRPPINSLKQYDRIVVAHPLLARALKNVWYLHGEIALPEESIIREVEKIVVPLEKNYSRLITHKLHPSQILVSGLIVAPQLTLNPEKAFLSRLDRLAKAQRLKIGFFVSGAYPKPHIVRIIEGVNSVLLKEHRAFLFLGIERKKAQMVIKKLGKRINNQVPQLMVLIQGRDRKSYLQKVNDLLGQLDLIVAPSHEHTNWAVGLGLPMFTLFPLIGSYAAENYAFLLENKVTFPLEQISQAQNLASIIDELQKSGRLLKMAQNGFNRYPIDGAIKTAQAILES
jgi:hypothetical protein